ncbi:MAG: type II secretion system protein GspL [Gammaproteobacteria bacterium]
MLTCFLFIQTDDLNTILSLRMDLQGQIEQPLQMRTPEEIWALQDNARTVIVLPTHWCGLYQVELPLLADRKAREAIPFALEDQLAQSLTQVHFVFDRAHYQNGKYLVVVIDKQIMANWMAKLSNLELSYDQITIDWFALQAGEGCVGTHAVLVNAPMFQGALSLDIWENFEHNWAKDLDWQIFTDSAALAEWSQIPRQQGSIYAWFAERLCKAKIINLCQGEFQHATSQATILRKYQLAGILAAAWLISFISIHLGLYTVVNHQSQKIDQQIAQSYRVFFPGAQQVISPKARITQLLKQSQSGNNANLWSLMESFSLALVQVKPDPASKTQSKMASQLQSLHYQSPILTAIFLCDNFSALEQIESFLRKRKVKVKQISAATEEDKVLAKLELSI